MRPPLPGYLEGLRTVTQKYGALLIFDEVMTGFRLALGGAQQRYGIRPDLTTLGKIIGGGCRSPRMAAAPTSCRKIAPVGPIYQAGTLSGNPLAVTAGIAMLQYLQAHPEVYGILEERTAQLTAESAPGRDRQQGWIDVYLLLHVDPVTDWESAKRADIGRFKEFFHFMLDRGIYLGALAVRSRVRLHRPHRSRHRPNR